MNIGVADPLEIVHPESGFLGYLLRCKAPPEENCTQSIIICKPNKRQELIYEHLPEKLQDRIAIRKEWYHEAKKHHRYAAVLADIPEDADFDEYEAEFPATEQEVHELVEEICQYCEESLPSYDIFAIVVHSRPLRKCVGNGSRFAYCKWQITGGGKQRRSTRY